MENLLRSKKSKLPFNLEQQDRRRRRRRRRLRLNRRHLFIGPD